MIFVTDVIFDTNDQTGQFTRGSIQDLFLDKSGPFPGFVSKNFDTGIEMLLFQDSGKVLRSEEHTSALQSLMRISYPVFCLNKQPDTILSYAITQLTLMQTT